MICKAITRAGSKCKYKRKSGGKYCGRHLDYVPADKDNAIDLTKRKKDIKWSYEDTLYMNDTIKPTRRRKRTMELMTVVEVVSEESESEIIPKKKKKSKKSKSSKEEDTETTEESYSYSSSDEDSFNFGGSTYKKSSIASLIKLGICSFAVLVEDMVDESLDVMIAGTMKELGNNETAMEALEEIIEEYLPENLIGEEASPLLTFTALYLTTAAIKHSTNNAKAELLQARNIPIQSVSMVETDPVIELDEYSEDYSIDSVEGIESTFEMV